MVKKRITLSSTNKITLGDPWRDCTRLYSKHFSERMQQRFLPDSQVALALRDGNKIEEKKGEFTIKWNKWTLKISQGNCFLTLQTAIRSKKEVQ